jgi:hypothetical protein
MADDNDEDEDEDDDEVIVTQAEGAIRAAPELVAAVDIIIIVAAALRAQLVGVSTQVTEPEKSE